MSALEWFDKQVTAIAKPDILEIGTKNWGGASTHWRARYPQANKYILSDYVAGADVDVMADAHILSRVFGENSFDVIIAKSVFEHLRKPWIVAQEMLKTLKHGGVFLVVTHNCFPIHSYPYDYFRYTKDGLESLFDGVGEVVTNYDFPCEIHSQLGKQTNCYLNVCIAGRKL